METETIKYIALGACIGWMVGRILAHAVNYLTARKAMKQEVLFKKKEIEQFIKNHSVPPHIKRAQESFNDE